MRFTRIKVTDRVVELDWIEKSANGEKRTVSLESAQRPMPALLLALSAFKPFVAELLELPAQWDADMRVTTINVDEGKDGRRGLIITCVKAVAKASGRPLVLNTPQMREPNSDGEDVEGFLPDDILTLVGKAEVCAGAFVNGEREQTELPLGTPATAVETPSDNLGKRRRRKNFIPEVGELHGSESTTVLDDAAVRSRLFARGRDVPIDAIAGWPSSEREAVLRWLDTIETIGTEEPAALVRDATMSLLEDLARDHADDGAAKGDDWTSETPPPKASDVVAVAP